MANYKSIPAKSTKNLLAGLPETRLSSVQTIQPTHTKPATDREKKVQTENYTRGGLKPEKQHL